MSRKRQILVDTALQLFYEKGVNSVGINELLKVSGIAKKTLYNHFDSKQALVLAALKQRNDKFMTWLEMNLNEASTDKEVIARLFHGLSAWFTDSAAELGNFRGCFFINTSSEFSDPCSDVSQYCQYHKRQVRALISKHLSNPSPELLDTICVLKEGAITIAYVNKDFSMPQKCISILDKLL
ncbi:TetR/AcrR family transcriptional regulator [Thalassotalea sp. ND16A]|uniref:TetR/AcrR family transcriptional regulator n=1 Tax=Thalassotalea sp. ND16A TaxID=1535422 RepID=UPI00051A52CE|nr:TetR/AcrR family transcriptional regulator [Thalassotalea sp. ND16A]KGJ95841.1 putative transcriptional regulator, TetR family [Thalassotalea sp. ND16A]